MTRPPTALIAAGILAGATTAFALHPAYLHARTDLRICQWYLRQGSEEPNVQRHMQLANEEIEHAIHEIDHAAVIDNKDLDEHPRTDTNLDRSGRFHKMVDLLRNARRDISQEEDNSAALGWRDEACRRIDRALENVHKAAIDLRIDRDMGF